MWKIIGASVAGNSHLAVGRACEDASAWHAADGCAFLTIADGAGSRVMSRDGASLAVGRALLLATKVAAAGGDPIGQLPLIFADVREQIVALAGAEGRDADDYATTLAVAVLTPAEVGIAQVGDTIAVVGRGGGYETVAPAPRGEYVNETTFLTGQDALAEIRVRVYPAAEVDGVFLATDGLRFKILDNLAASTPFTPFFDDLAAYAGSEGASDGTLSRFLEGLDDQSGDDKTLVAAVRAVQRAGSDEATVRSGESDQSAFPERSGAPWGSR
jgi:hypothetical protein